MPFASAQIFISVISFLVLAIVLISLLMIFSGRRNKRQITRALNMSLFLISLPKKKQPEQDKKSVLAVMEQLYASLSNMRERTFLGDYPHLSFEIAVPHVGEEISFYLAAPAKYAPMIEKQIHGLFPSAAVEPVEDYNIFNPQGAEAACYLRLSKPYLLPFKTYQELEADSFESILNALSKLAFEGEGAAMQVLFRPAVTSWAKHGAKVISLMRQGRKFSEAYPEVSSAMKMLVKPASRLEPSASAPSMLPPGQEEIIKAIEKKTSKSGLDVNLRLIVSAATSQRAEELLRHLEASFAQFNAPNLNQIQFVKTKNRSLRRLIYDFSFRLINQRQLVVLSTEELVSLIHFPTSATAASKLKYVKAESAAPPANLPAEGLVLGKNIYRGVEVAVHIKDEDRRRHLYLVGQTGTGKSAMIKNLIVQDIKNGRGVGLLDPHGDAIEDLLGLIPQERAEDLVLIDPADLARPVGLNMLEYDARFPEQKTFVVNELINIFDKLYDLKQTGGPMFEQYTRNALLLLMDDPAERYTLMEVPKVLADKNFRQQLLAKCRNVVVKDFWQKEAEKAGGEAALANMAPYITSKFNVFIANDYMRPIIGQPESTLDFRQMMDQGKILLVNLSKGRLGDINSSLLGLIVVGKLLMASFSRVDVPEEQRRDFYLYLDEFQNFATESIATILSEARKYRLCLTIAHQFIGQLKENIRDAVFGNVGSMAAFRVGAEDAEFLAKQFEPVFDQNDLINIDNFNCYLKLMIGGQTSRAFNIGTYAPEKGRAESVAPFKEISARKYGRPAREVEEGIGRRWQSGVGPAVGSAVADSDMSIR